MCFISPPPPAAAVAAAGPDLSPLLLFQEYRQLDLMAYATKIAGDVERLTAKSSLGRLGSSSPSLPAPSAAALGGAGELLLSSLEHPNNNNNNNNNNKNNGRHREGWGRAVNGVDGSGGSGGGGGGGGGGDRTRGAAAGDTLEVEVERKVADNPWRGGREDDIIG